MYIYVYMPVYASICHTYKSALGKPWVSMS